MDGAHLTLELDGSLDVLQHDGAGSSARNFDGPVVAEAPPEVLFDEDALNLADDNLVGVTVNPSVTVKEAFIAHKDGRCQVANQSAQMQIGPLAQTRSIPRQDYDIPELQ